MADWRRYLFACFFELSPDILNFIDAKRRIRRANSSTLAIFCPQLPTFLLLLQPELSSTLCYKTPFMSCTYPSPSPNCFPSSFLSSRKPRGRPGLAKVSRWPVGDCTQVTRVTTIPHPLKLAPKVTYSTRAVPLCCFLFSLLLSSLLARLPGLYRLVPREDSRGKSQQAEEVTGAKVGCRIDRRLLWSTFVLFCQSQRAKKIRRVIESRVRFVLRAAVESFLAAIKDRRVLKQVCRVGGSAN